MKCFQCLIEFNVLISYFEKHKIEGQIHIFKNMRKTKQITLQKMTRVFRETYKIQFEPLYASEGDNF